MLWILNCGRPKLPAFFGTVTGGNTISELLINERIREPEVRVIGEDGAQLGIMSSREALKIAEEHELDLILIAPTAKPPVCRIMDYGR